MLELKALIEIRDFNELTNLLKYFINREDLRFYRFIIETNDSGIFTIYRDLEYIYVEQEKFENNCRIVNTGKFKNLDDVIPFIRVYKNDIILEIEVVVTINQFEEINDILNEVRQFNPIALQILTEIVIYEEFRN